MPRSFLLQAGLNPDTDFRRVAYSGAHDATIASVVSGKVDAAALDITVWKKFTSEGKVDTKASQIKGITTGGNKYEAFDHKERTFIPAGPGIVLMKGRILMHMSGKAGKVVNDLNYLAVWREEQGKWRFLAWQSCKNPPAVEAPAGAKAKASVN